MSLFSALWEPVANTPTTILTDILSVDGAGSGLDADLLDGLQGSAYQLTTGLDATRIAQDIQVFEYLTYGAM